MRVVDNDGGVVSRQAQPFEQRAGNASAAKKNDGALWLNFHARSTQAWSAASISLATSFSVCAVEMIQCSPFEGVM